MPKLSECNFGTHSGKKNAAKKSIRGNKVTKKKWRKKGGGRCREDRFVPKWIRRDCRWVASTTTNTFMQKKSGKEWMDNKMKCVRACGWMDCMLDGLVVHAFCCCVPPLLVPPSSLRSALYVPICTFTFLFFCYSSHWHILENVAFRFFWTCCCSSFERHTHNFLSLPLALVSKKACKNMYFFLI